jgi:phosphoserine phosphatase RsbX
MNGAESCTAGVLAWGTAGTALTPGTESGDLHVVAPREGGALVAVIDGLGHGSEAAHAAREAAAALLASAHEPLDEVVVRCHAAIRRTRGVVMSLAAFTVDASSMTWLGVGNVDGALLRADPTGNQRNEALATRGGVVGYKLPRLHASVLQVEEGDLLLLATDGIKQGYHVGIRVADDVQRTADGILAAHARGDDDALVLVARYLGAPR